MKDLGEKLKNERIQKGVSLEDLAERIKISPSKLSALESGELKKLPSRSYLRGFIQTYCRVLHLNEAEFLVAFDQTFGRTNAKESLTNYQENTKEITSKELASIKNFSLKFLLIFFGFSIVIVSFYFKKIMTNYSKETLPLESSPQQSLSDEISNQKSEPHQVESLEISKGSNQTTEISPRPSPSLVLKETIQKSPQNPVNPTNPALSPIKDSNHSELQKKISESLKSDEKVNQQTEVNTTPSTKIESSEIKKTKETTVTSSEISKKETIQKEKPSIDLSTENPKENRILEKTMPQLNSSFVDPTEQNQTLKPSLATYTVVIDALDTVVIQYSVDGSSLNKITLQAGGQHTLKGSRKMYVKVNDGGLANFTINNSDKGIMGHLGKSFEFSVP